jgi:zinc transport system substrate-binding protein
MMRFDFGRAAIVWSVWGLVLSGCGSAPEDTSGPSGVEAARKPVVYVVNYPLQYFARRIGGDQIDVVFPAPADEDPAFWQPDDQAIRGYQDADLILLNGASYAKWIDRVSLPRLQMIDTSRAFASQYIAVEERTVHQHGPEGEHAHEGVAFTTWLDPQLALQQAAAIHAAFAERWPEHAAAFATNWAAFQSDWEALDARLTAVNADYQKEPLLASHPVYQYLARRCGWNLRSLHWEPGEMPDDPQWQQFQEIQGAHGARWMIWEDEPLPEVRQRLADLGVACAVFLPCGNVPESGDLLQVMNENLQRLEPVLEAKPDTPPAEG